MGPLTFTCLIPVHAADDADDFRAAFASILANSLPPDRILVCQDGGLPPALAEAVASTRAEVILNSGPPGLHHNLNRALREVRTPWICRADADDINLPERFGRQVAFLSSHPDISVLGGTVREIAPDGKSHNKIMPLTHKAIVARAAWRNPVNHMTAFIRTRAIHACGGYPDISRKEDYGLWLAMIARGARFANLPDVLVEARTGRDFLARRAGLHNLASERALYRLRGRTPAAALTHLARAAALSSRTVARGVYLGLLRR